MFASICWQPDLCDWDAEAHNLRITSSTRTTLPLNQPLRRACCTRVLSMIATLSILRARYVGQNGDLQLSKLTNHTSFHPDFVPVSCKHLLHVIVALAHLAVIPYGMPLAIHLSFMTGNNRTNIHPSTHNTPSGYTATYSSTLSPPGTPSTWSKSCTTKSWTSVGSPRFRVSL